VKEQMNKQTVSKTKVFLIAGFLGSGKTTLLKRILGWQKDLADTVVLVNEFGEVGIDGDLLRGAGSDVVELTSGCICCTLTSDLLQCLTDIHNNFKPRRILIESSGVADPAAVVSVLTDSKLAEYMELEKIVTVLDAEYWDVRENFGTLFFSQLETASLILLNKIDLVEEELVPNFLQEIHKEILGSHVVPTIRCTIDPETLWTPKKHREIEIQPMRFFKEMSFTDGEEPSSTTIHRDENHSTSVAANNFITFSFETSRILDEKRFKQFIDQVPWELFRMKGPVQFTDRSALVNFVGGKSEWAPLDGKPKTRLAFIGWSVDPDEILEQVKGCLT
jgi:G3E family GTPase